MTDQEQPGRRGSASRARPSPQRTDSPGTESAQSRPRSRSHDRAEPTRESVEDEHRAARRGRIGTDEGARSDNPRSSEVAGGFNSGSRRRSRRSTRNRGGGAGSHRESGSAAAISNQQSEAGVSQGLPGAGAPPCPDGSRTRHDAAGATPTTRDTSSGEPSSRTRSGRRRGKRKPPPAPVAQAPTVAPGPDRSSTRARASRRKPGGRGRSAGARTPQRATPVRQASLEFGTTWWARRWLAALERFGWAARLERGRDYARRGNVLDMEITPGHIRARVQGSRPWPYDVQIALQTLNDEQWERVVKRLSRQAIYAAKLLAGDMPQNIEDIFNAADVPLIPKRQTDLTMSCTCPDPVTPCKHLAAVHYVLGAEFDRDPFVLFELRGRTRQQVIQAMQGGARDGAFPALALLPTAGMSPDAPESSEGFWKAAADLNSFPIRIESAPVPGGLLKRLGPLPLRGLSDDWRLQLFDAYRLITRRASALGRGDDPE